MTLFAGNTGSGIGGSCRHVFVSDLKQELQTVRSSRSCRSAWAGQLQLSVLRRIDAGLVESGGKSGIRLQKTCKKAGPISDERIGSHATETGDFQVDKGEYSVNRFLPVRVVQRAEKHAMRATHNWKVSVAARRSQVDFFHWCGLN